MSKIVERRWTLIDFKPGWFFRKRRHIFELESGEIFTVIDANDDTIDTIDALPFEYLQLGNYSADRVDSQATDVRQAKALAESVIAENAMLKQRIKAAPEAEKIVPILSADLEKAINMMMRFAQSLGIMSQGPLYDEIQALASKYGMSYREPTREFIRGETRGVGIPDDLSADKMIAEFDPGTGRLGFYPAPGATIDGTVTDEQRALPPGNYDIEDDGDPC